MLKNISKTKWINYISRTTLSNKPNVLNVKHECAKLVQWKSALASQ